MRVNIRNFFTILIIFITTIWLVYISLFVINNPDKYNYLIIMNTSTSFSLGIEPTVYFISSISRTMSLITGFEPLVFFYFQYIFLIQLFLIFSFLNFFKNSIVKSGLLLIFWLCTYGIMHCLIQIRFGLASSIVVYIFSLIYLHKDSANNFFLKPLILGVVAIFTHYSVIFSIFTIFLQYLRFKINKKNSYLISHVGFLLILIMFKLGELFNILPIFLMARISVYINSMDLEPVSDLARLVSFFCYFSLLLAPNLKNKVLNDLRIYGSLSFLPYFIIPEMEILVRLGIPFQYLLLSYLVLTYSYKKLLFFSTLPLLIFFSYKIYSGISAFISYM